MIFRECEYCHAALDPGERCDCREEAEREKRKADAERRADFVRSLMTMAPRSRGKKKKP